MQSHMLLFKAELEDACSAGRRRAERKTVTRLLLGVGPRAALALAGLLAIFVTRVADVAQAVAAAAT